MPSDIFLTKDVAGKLKQYLQERDYSSTCILVDENSEKYCFPVIKDLFDNFSLITIQSGEEHKSLETCSYIWEQMTNFGMDRKALMINLGGGIIGDMGGFCASTYKRGVDFIQIPTTLLSQVDASVGGKLGIDFKGFKNHIGVFKEPVAVLIDTTFLRTLPKTQVKAGFAEIIKHCLIGDGKKWDEIRQKRYDEQDWEDLTKHSVKFKNGVVLEDPQEKGLRKILNFGHTAGHAIETHFLSVPGKALLHGEAVAIGMVIESFISYQKKLLPKKDLEKIKEYIISVFGKKDIFEFDTEKILPLMFQDKKNEKGKILCTLLEGPGQPVINQAVSLNDVREGINFYMQ